MAEIDEMREMAKKYWKDETIPCAKHIGGILHGAFVATTYADHILLTCSKGKETITIPQRPKQVEFNEPQVEGLIVSLQRGDNVLCYRCQSKLVMGVELIPGTDRSRYIFTCVRCFSYGTWEGTTVNQVA